VENLPVGVFIKETKELRFVLWSKGNEELIGLSRSEVIGKNDHDFFSRAEADLFMAKDRQTLAQGHVVNVSEETIQTRHHGQRTLLTRKVPIMDEHERPAYLLGISEDITERKLAEAELEKTQKKLIEASRQAGMAEVATGVLHNVGNVLNSVNVAATCVADGLRRSKALSLSKVVALLREHETDLSAFFAADPKGKQLPAYLAQLAGHLAGEQAVALKELAGLQKNIEHIKDIVAMQQSFAKVSGVTETLGASDLVEDALRMNSSALARHDIQIVREFDAVPPLTVEKHKVLQILVNLITNAKYACDESERPDKQVTLRVTNGDGRVRIAVIDNGKGIPAENLTRIFAHGFTTKSDGHGFGLHSGALAAREMGGSLTVSSDGYGRGARFTLELPARADANIL
jgi:PAS domain S-box-containing protein